MEYYEFHYLVNDLVDHMKTENKQNAGQQEQTNDMMGSIKMPSMKMPSMKMPKM